jgi:hypothetical protein
MKTPIIIAAVTIAIFAAAMVAVGIYNNSQRQPFDADEYLAKSVVTAMTAHPNAKPIEVTAEAITSDGKVHLEQKGSLAVRFLDATSAMPGTPGIPGARVGAPMQPGGCPGGEVRTRLFRRNTFEHFWHDEPQRCLPLLDGPPKCSFKQIWAKAKAKGAPDPAFADINLTEEVGSGGQEKRWRFEISNHLDLIPSAPLFHAEFPDDC